MWELLTVIGIGTLVALIARGIYQHKKPTRKAEVQDVYVCPSCSSSSCDCFKRKA